MKQTLQTRLRLRSGQTCTVTIEAEGPPVHPDRLIDAVVEGLRGANDANGHGAHGNGHALVEAAPEATSEAEVEEAADREDIKIHGKAKKTVHKVVLALDQRANRGTPATVDDIERGTGLSRPAIYRVLDADTPQGRYARGLIRVTKDGNAYAVDITQAGRNMASRLRTRPI